MFNKVEEAAMILEDLLKGESKRALQEETSVIRITMEILYAKKQYDQLVELYQKNGLDNQQYGIMVALLAYYHLNDCEAIETIYEQIQATMDDELLTKYCLFILDLVKRNEDLIEYDMNELLSVFNYMSFIKPIKGVVEIYSDYLVSKGEYKKAYEIRYAQTRD